MDKKELFNRAFDVLVTCCRMHDNEYDRFSFVHRYAESSTRPPSEFRIQGALGFGGKFRYPGFTVDCYPENETPARKEMVQRANLMLEPIRLEFEKEQLSALAS
jgi:hypothetical protein